MKIKETTNQKKGITMLILNKKQKDYKVKNMIKKANLSKTGTFHMQIYILSNSMEMYIAITTGNTTDRQTIAKERF